MSQKPAAIPLFADAYLADTTHLTTEEHGAYLLLLMAAWRQDDCGLPDDDRKLARITGLTPRKWASMKPTIMEFWQVEGGRIYQSRLRKEHDFVCKKSEANRKAAASRWEKQNTEKVEDGGMRLHSDRNAPPPPPIEDTNVSSPPKPPRGQGKTGLPADWTAPAVADLPPQAKQCAGQWPEGAYARHAEAFHSYWRSNGKKMTDWRLTWANRVIAIHDDVMRRHQMATRFGSPEITSSSPMVERILRERQHQ
jgi:uncharacterized protein YdaU (DUF1376 family)